MTLKFVPIYRGKRWSIQVLLAATAALGVFGSAPVSALAAPAKTADFKGARDFIVLYKQSADLGSRLKGEVARDNQVKRRFTSSINGALLSLGADDVNRLRADDRVLLVERDQPVEVAASRSASSPGLWGLDRIDERAIPRDGLIETTNDGSGVEVYIVDTGIRLDHTQFTGRINPEGFTSISDGRGWNDCDGHGTHVAGTVAGKDYGVAPSARLTSVRILNCNGEGTNSGVIDGIDWIIRDHLAGQAAVSNLSIGGGYSSSLNSAIQRAIDDGVSMVVAAGNDDEDACLSSPASARNAITVGSTNYADQRSEFSNIGTCVDLFAPGSAILSAYHTSSSAFETLWGTSMASPHAAGAAALILSATPSLSPAQVTTQMRNSATAGILTGHGAGSPNLLLYSGTNRPETGSYGRGEVTRLVSGSLGIEFGITVEAEANSNICGQDFCDWRLETLVFPEAVACNSRGTGGVHAILGSRQLRPGSYSHSKTFYTTGFGAPLRVCLYLRGESQYWEYTNPVYLVEDRVISPGGSQPGDPDPPDDPEPPSSSCDSSSAPSNDNFSNRSTLTVPGSVTGTTCGATAEPGEGANYSTYGPYSSIWYRWTAPSSGTLTLDATGTAFSHTLGVYTGSTVGSLTRRAAGFGVSGAKVTIPVVSGEAYSVALDGIHPAERGATRLTSSFKAGPPNDDFANAIELNVPGETRGTNLNATVQEDEPAHDYYQQGPHESIWYKWTAPSSGRLTLDTEGSNFTTNLAVYSGQTLASLVQRATKEDPTAFSPLEMRVIGGRTYHIAIDSDDLYWETPSLTYLNSTFESGPANDDFRNAQEINSFASPVVGSTVSASAENGEPRHAGMDPVTSIWYRWTPEQSGRIRLDPLGSDVPTRLAVYRGESIETLVPEGSGSRSSVTISVTGGQEYYLVLDGVREYSDLREGRVQIAGTFTPRPENDEFANATVLTNLSPRTVSTVAATAESNEPSHADNVPAARSVWYRWTAPSKAFVSLRTDTSTFCQAIAVYSGDALDSLLPVASDWNSNASVEFRAQAGVTYRIAIDQCLRSSPQEGTLRLSGEFIEPPVNDDFASAIELSPSPSQSISGTTLKATAEEHEPRHGTGSGGPYESIWYRWTATGSGMLGIELTEVQGSADVALYRGSALANLTKTASGTWWKFEARVQKGIDYWIAVDTGPSDCLGCPDGGPVRLFVEFEADADDPPEDPPVDPPVTTPLRRPSFLSGPSSRTWSRKAEFRFSGVQGARHQCWSTARPYWNGCRSPLVLKGLWAGRHTMKVRQTKEGQVSAVATYRWTVVKKPRR